MPKVTVVITVRNEEKTVVQLLERLVSQTQLPSEVIITDANSTDRTVERIFQFQQKNLTVPVRVFSVPGNRSRGRNEAIKSAKTDLIAITDAGCLPSIEWLDELVKTYTHALKTLVDLEDYPAVAGYAVGAPQTDFQEAVTPFFLPMPDQINPKTYLPTTRSLLIHKDTWKHVGGFNEAFNTSEDFLFSHQLLRHHVPILFSEKAVVSWQPPSSYVQTLKTFISFAACDVEGGVVRPKVIVLFARYILGALIVAFLLSSYTSITAVLFVVIVMFGYSFWAMYKHRRYVHRGLYWQPLLQFGADFAVMSGSMYGAAVWVKNQLVASSSA